MPFQTSVVVASMVKNGTMQVLKCRRKMYSMTSSQQENTYKRTDTLRLNTWLFLGVLMADFL